MATNTPSSSPSPQPNPDLQGLNRLVGTWNQSGGLGGQVTYEWAEGGHFLLQHVDLLRPDNRIRGLEVIGHLQPFGEAPGEAIKSRFYSFSDGLTLDYEYELVGNTLTIWGGEKGSPAYFRGTFGADSDTLTGAWVYPGGGGYEAISTRVREFS